MTGVWFDAPNPLLAHHVAPLQQRLQDIQTDRRSASIVVMAHEVPPRPRLHHVQLFHGVGDKGHTLNPRLLQTSQHRWLRTMLDRRLMRMGLGARFMRPPRRMRPGPSAYETLNAYGPYFRDRLERLLPDADVAMCGHGALNDLGAIEADTEGPVFWVPTWDSRVKWGGQTMTGLASHAEAMLALADEVPVRVKWHPMVDAFDQFTADRRRLAEHRNVDIVPTNSSFYEALRGVRGVVTDTSSAGFEAFALGIPVAIARPLGFEPFGLHAMLEERVPVLGDRRAVLEWARAPEPPGDRNWAEDLVLAPDPRHNDRLAQHLRRIHQSLS